MIKKKDKSKFTTKFIRDQLDKQDYKCYLSGLPLDSYNTEAEHIIPLGKKHNGDHIPENIVFVRKELKSLKRECSVDEILQICKEIVKLHG
jgi:5-methylcytosine-specific restriction endonuclease McrA